MWNGSLKISGFAHRKGCLACTPGRVRWTFTYDETVVVVQGTATVGMDSGSQVSLQPGDMLFFERGQGSIFGTVV